MRTYEERTERIWKKARARKRRRNRRIAIFSAALAVLLVCNLVMFVPFSTGGYDLSKYKNSEYYPLMAKIGELTYEKPQKTNLFTQMIKNFNVIKYGGEIADNGIDNEPPSSDANSGYQEVTNNQVAGVIEGYLFKRSSEYIFYLGRKAQYGENASAGYTLSVYSVAEKKLVGEKAILPEEGTYFVFYADYPEELFLSEDCSTVTLFAMCRRTENDMLYTVAVNLDVRDPLSPEEVGRFYMTGGYASARHVGGFFLLATTFYLNKEPDFDRPEEYLPQTGSLGALENIPMADVLLPENADMAQYTALALLDGKSLQTRDCAALFSYTSEIYVSEDHLFAAHEVLSYHDAKETDVAYRYSTRDTEIACYSYREGLALEGVFTVKGEIENQYSMDEHGGTLRVVTTSQNSLLYASSANNAKPAINFTPECNLYCIDLERKELLASVENFSDPNERVKSVRFDGDKAYVCTAEINYHYDFGNDYSLFVPIITDPVFEFDLSDYAHITVKDTGTISGYSMSLIKFTDDTLLGIGYGEDFQTLKIELYRAEESSVVPFAKFELNGVFFSADFKAYFIDKEHGLVGLGVEQTGGSNYLLLQFDGERLNLLTTLPLALYDSPDLMRACLIAEEIYLLSENGLTVYKL